MQSGCNGVNRMMNVHGEVEQTARREDSGKLTHNPFRRFSMINYVVAKHDIEALIRKWQRFPTRGDRLRTPLPDRKQPSITNREWIDSYSGLRSEIENQSMRSTSDLNHTRFNADRLKRLEQLAHTMRRALHRIDDLVFMTANVFGFAFLIRKLPFERTLRKLLPPTHSFVLFVA
jgi:hypothetical protein